MPFLLRVGNQRCLSGKAELQPIMGRVVVRRARRLQVMGTMRATGRFRRLTTSSSRCFRRAMSVLSLQTCRGRHDASGNPLAAGGNSLVTFRTVAITPISRIHCFFT